MIDRFAQIRDRLVGCDPDVSNLAPPAFIPPSALLATKLSLSIDGRGHRILSGTRRVDRRVVRIAVFGRRARLDGHGYRLSGFISRRRYSRDEMSSNCRRSAKIDASLDALGISNLRSRPSGPILRSARFAADREAIRNESTLTVTSAVALLSIGLTSVFGVEILDDGRILLRDLKRLKKSVNSVQSLAIEDAISAALFNHFKPFLGRKQDVCDPIFGFCHQNRWQKPDEVCRCSKIQRVFITKMRP